MLAVLAKFALLELAMLHFAMTTTIVAHAHAHTMTATVVCSSVPSVSSVCQMRGTVGGCSSGSTSC